MPNCGYKNSGGSYISFILLNKSRLNESNNYGPSNSSYYMNPYTTNTGSYSNSSRTVTSYTRSTQYDGYTRSSIVG